MKKIFYFIGAVLAVYMMSYSFVACTDVNGDGIDSVLYTGSTLSQNTSFHNPVWEPDLEGGTIFKGPTSFVAIGSETQWAQGINYCAPTLLSNNLMSWSYNANTAYPVKPDTVVSGTETIINKRPDWATGRIHSMSAAFAKTIISTSYWMFYQIGTEQSIGVSCARSPQGPYSDFGKLIDVTNTGTTQIKDPFFIVSGIKFYLFYTTEQGTYAQELTLKKSKIPVLKNAPIKVTGPGFSNVTVFKKDAYFYIYGTVANGDQKQINYGRASVITGPYADKTGGDLLTSNGTPLIQGGTEMINPENVCGVFTDFTGIDFILYNATDKNKTLLTSGFDRRPLMLNKIGYDANGWADAIIVPAKGWTSPKYIDK